MGKSQKRPRQGAERGCDYEIVKRRGGIEIVMDCARCGPEPGLDGQRCFSNALAAMQREGVPVAITLRSHVERRYGVEACDGMGRITTVLNKLDSLRAQLRRDAGKSEACAGCVTALTGKLAIIDGRLRAMDLNSSVASAWDLEREEFGSARCGDCAGLTRVQLADIAKSLRGLERAGGGIRILEGRE